jgi:hypothetical protein
MKTKLHVREYLSMVLGPNLRAAAYWFTVLFSIVFASFLAYFISVTWYRAHYILLPVCIFVAAFVWSNLRGYSSLLEKLKGVESKLHSLEFETEFNQAGEHLQPFLNEQLPAHHHIVISIGLVARNGDGQSARSIELTDCATDIHDRGPDELFFEPETYQTFQVLDQRRRSIESGAIRTFRLRAVYRLPITTTMTSQMKVTGHLHLRDNRGLESTVPFEAPVYKNPISS